MLTKRSERKILMLLEHVRGTIYIVRHNPQAGRNLADDLLDRALEDIECMQELLKKERGKS
jgi:hypothetical protein